MKHEFILLKTIIQNKDIKTFNELNTDFFIANTSKQLYETIKKLLDTYGELPTLDTLTEIPEININLESIPTIDNINFLLNFCIESKKQNLIYSKLYEIIENTDSANEILEQLQDFLLSFNNFDDNTEEIDLSESQPNITTDFIEKIGFPEWDETNGGMSKSDLLLLGGSKGTGKSIIAVNLALYNYIHNHKTTYLYSVEMRANQVIGRIDAIISGVNASLIRKNQLTITEKLKILEARSRVFKTELLDIHKYPKTLDGYSKAIKDYKQLPSKKEKLLIFDTPSLTVHKILQTIQKRKDVDMAIVDYLNITKISANDSDLYDWKGQIQKANKLKEIARQFDVKMVGLVQTHEDETLKFSKALDDAADCLITFNRNRDNDIDLLSFNTKKVRNGVFIKFDMFHDNALRLYSNETKLPMITV